MEQPAGEEFKASNIVFLRNKKFIKKLMRFYLC